MSLIASITQRIRLESRKKLPRKKNAKEKTVVPLPHICVDGVQNRSVLIRRFGCIRKVIRHIHVHLSRFCAHDSKKFLNIFITRCFKRSAVFAVEILYVDLSVCRSVCPVLCKK